MSRIKSIRDLLQSSPDDTFLLYSLGMELLGEGHADEAVDPFGKLLELDPEYLAGYTQLGQALTAVGDVPGARAAFEAGLVVADRQNDRHSRDRLELLLKALGESD